MHKVNIHFITLCTVLVQCTIVRTNRLKKKERRDHFLMMDVDEHGNVKEDRIDADLLMQNSRNIDAFLTALYIIGGNISGSR